MTCKDGLENQSGRKILDSGVQRLIYCVFCIMLCIMLFPLTSLAQTYQPDEQPPVSEPYRESALRRFEIIFTTSLPFTALHSYLAVRGVGMMRQRKVSPKLEQGDWNAVGGLTILFSGFIAFWDWMHTRDEDISEKAIMPRRPTDLYSGQPALDARHSALASSIRYPASGIQYLEITLLSGRF
jgi:hypothetical protein